MASKKLKDKVFIISSPPASTFFGKMINSLSYKRKLWIVKISKICSCSGCVSLFPFLPNIVLHLFFGNCFFLAGGL